MTEPVGVVDIGSSSTKVGYCGDDIPFAVFPSTLAKLTKYVPCIESNPETHSLLSDVGVGNRYDSMHPVHRGIVRDWEKLSKFWESITNELGSESDDSTSILLVESNRTTKKDRAKWAEILFESHHAPSICFLNSSSASIYGSGRTSGLSVDCGAGLTSTVPVYEGLPLKHAALTSDYGGQDVTHQLQQLLIQNHVNLTFSDVRMIKESRAGVSSTVIESPRSTEGKITTLTLPDGIDVEVDENIFFECTNSIFHDDKDNHKGLVGQVHESVRLCDESLKRLLYGNVILSGGTTQLPGFGDRLRWEILDKISMEAPLRSDGPNYDVNVVPNSFSREAGYTTQSKYAAWIGGSIVGSMETYKDIKITRQEWEENADSISETKSY